MNTDHTLRMAKELLTYQIYLHGTQLVIADYFAYLPGLIHYLHLYWRQYKVMLLNVTFNNMSAIQWRSVLLVEETGVPGENY